MNSQVAILTNSVVRCDAVVTQSCPNKIYRLA